MDSAALHGCKVGREDHGVAAGIFLEEQKLRVVRKGLSIIQINIWSKIALVIVLGSISNRNGVAILLTQLLATLGDRRRRRSRNV